jgi:hypothetical protein
LFLKASVPLHEEYIYGIPSPSHNSSGGQWELGVEHLYQSALNCKWFCGEKNAELNTQMVKSVGKFDQYL